MGPNQLDDPDSVDEPISVPFRDVKIITQLTNYQTQQNPSLRVQPDRECVTQPRELKEEVLDWTARIKNGQFLTRKVRKSYT